MKVRSERQPVRIEWEGDSTEVLTSFPHDVKATLGFSLRQIQIINYQYLQLLTRRSPRRVLLMA